MKFVVTFNNGGQELECIVDAESKGSIREYLELTWLAVMQLDKPKCIPFRLWTPFHGVTLLAETFCKRSRDAYWADEDEKNIVISPYSREEFTKSNVSIVSLDEWIKSRLTQNHWDIKRLIVDPFKIEMEELPFKETEELSRYAQDIPLGGKYPKEKE